MGAAMANRKRVSTVSHQALAVFSEDEVYPRSQALPRTALFGRLRLPSAGRACNPYGSQAEPGTRMLNGGGFRKYPSNESLYNQTFTLSAANSGNCQLRQHGSDRLH